MRTTYEDVTLADGALSRTVRFDPEGTPTGVIHFVYGFGEHIGMYETTGGDLSSLGYAVVVHEQRGHGPMPGKTPRERRAALGVVPSYAWFLKDITTVRGLIGTWYPGSPVFLWGLSMGGNIAANYVERVTHPPYDKVVLESPWLRLHQPMPAAVSAVARVVGTLHPRLAVSSRLDLDAVTRDLGETDKLKQDWVYHDRISFRLYTQVKDAGEYAIAHADDIALPALVLTGTGDRIVSVDAIREMARRAGANVTLREFDGAYHCLHLDVNKAEVLSAVVEFLGADHT